MLLSKLQKADLIFQRIGWVKIGSIQNVFDLLQRKFQFPEKENGLELF